MKKIIETVDKKLGLKRVTTIDERWYIKESVNKVTGLPIYEYVPSVTWIAGHYPKGIAFYKWLADKGWDEAEAIKSAAGDKGSKVHRAIEDLISGLEIKMDAKYLNGSSGEQEELSLEEYECLMSFTSWFNTVKPKVISNESTVWGDGYAGTVDLVCEIAGEKYLVDFKTGQSIWPEYELQVSAYKKALGQDLKLAILQVGYKRNKAGYKWTELPDKYDLFLAAKKIWANETEGQSPKQRDYPLSLKLEKVAEIEKTIN